MLAEQRKGWSLMIFCARATRGLRRMRREQPGALFARRTHTMKLCSPGRRARLGALRVGRVRMSRAVEGSLGRSPKREWKELDALTREKAPLGALRVGRVKYCAQLETNRATPEQGGVSATRI